jgi:hypothetical protein
VALISLAATELSTANDLEKRLTTLKDEFGRIEAGDAFKKNRCANQRHTKRSREFAKNLSNSNMVLASSEYNADGHRAEHVVAYTTTAPIQPLPSPPGAPPFAVMAASDSR